MTSPDPSYTQRTTEGLRALSAVQKVFPDAVLAGGYLRDAWYGREQKDIDIFIGYVQKADNPTLLLQDQLGHDEIQPMLGSMYRKQGDVNSVWNVSGFDLPAQVIMLNPGHTPTSRAREHDFDFCQIWHDGWATGSTLDFRQANYREVTLVQCEDQTQFNRSMVRWERLKEKYPDFKLVIPPRYRHYV